MELQRGGTMNRVSKRLLCAGLLVAATAAVVPTVTASAEPPESPPIHSDDVRGHRQVDTSPALAAPVVVNGNGIDYHGGAVMRGQINAYVIWYGNWTNATKKGIIETFLNGIGGSPYFNINTGYGDPAGNVSGAVSYAGSTTDAYSQGKRNLSDTAIKRIVTSAITGNKLAKDPNGVYFVLTSSDVTKSGFLTQYCGWHTHSTISSTDVKYSFVGDPTGTRLSSCDGQRDRPRVGGDGQRPGSQCVVRQRGRRKRRQVRVDLRYHHRPGQRRQVQHDTGLQELPHPTELGQCPWGILRSRVAPLRYYGRACPGGRLYRHHDAG
jgi:hypothetical protein